MEYYSAIKRGAFESVLIRWMNLEPIIQSEVSQKEKDKYCILMNIWNLQRWHQRSHVSSVQFSSVPQSCPTLCNLRDCTTPGFPLHHQLPELTQTHVHQVGDAIHPSHPLSSLSPPAFNLSQHQGLFKWVSSSHQEAKVGARQQRRNRCKEQTFGLNGKEEGEMTWENSIET